MLAKQSGAVLLWLVFLLQPGRALAEVPRAEVGSDGPAAAVPPDAGVNPPALGPSPRWGYLMRLEGATLALLPRPGAGEDAGYLQVTPMLVAELGEDFGVNLGAPLRVRLWGGDGGWVRREGWDSLSDFGQVVRALKLGSDNAPLGVWLGALERYSLLSAHLVRRYSNRANPDYHPAGALLTGWWAPLYVEAFTSDMLGARLMGAEVEVDVEHVLFGRPKQRQHYTLSLSAVHEWGKTGGASPAMTLAHLDTAAVVLVRPGYELHVLAGWGGRPGDGGAWGAVAGVGADSHTPTRVMTLRLEARRQHGGFRQAFFGPDYEVGRFLAAGSAVVPLALAPFPDGYSAYGEAAVTWDAEALGGVLQRHLGPRYLVSGEARWRFAGKLYALASGGTLLFPEAGGTLRPGAFASFGLGVDHAR
ncbi:hypothetical protein [Pyxidicoccus trucidator]|uniref:hypothetical protein n=1 Tax=Pyxidicoccus trucidator TaxID=2709662 RepID=UPI0013DC6EA2